MTEDHRKEELDSGLGLGIGVGIRIKVWVGGMVSGVTGML